ncbi:MAG: MCP four helix bundle domain-containing protein, partial [Burkholderiaceae bacterium]|nr:MCP four helix bundle domain-containing protein [Burkholderiaceae bacterium]
MTIGKKIIGGYAVVLGLLAIVMFVAFYSLDRVQATYDGFIDVDVQLVGGVDKLRFELNDQVANYRGILLYSDLQKGRFEELQANRRRFNEIIGTMRQLVRSAEGRGMLEEIAALQAKNEQAQDQVIELARQGKHAEALTLGIEDVRPINATLINKAERFRDRELKLMAEGRAELAATVNLLTRVMWGASLFALVAGLAIGFYLSRAITRQLRESIAQIASSSSEILATTTQVASGAAETATAVSETTATVEEVKQTAQLASQKARF